MCQLQFIKRIDNKKLSDNDIKNFIKLMVKGNKYNNDAFGIFNNKVLYSQSGEFKKDIYDFSKCKKTNFIIGHNRYKTSGNTKNKNNHPFILNDFIMCHNGIFYNDDEIRKKFKIKSKIKTDSFVLLWLIDYYFNKSKEKTRRNKIIDAIKKAILEIQGYFSIFLYDIVKNDIYYFKSKDAEFMFYLIDEKIIIGTTKKENINKLYKKNKYVFEKKGYKSLLKYEPLNNTIYLINDITKIKKLSTFKINKGCDIKKPKSVSSGYIGYNYPLEYENPLSYYDYDDDNENKVLKIDDYLNTILGYIPKYHLINDERIKIKVENDYIKQIFGEMAIKEKKGYLYIYLEDLFYMLG